MIAIGLLQSSPDWRDMRLAEQLSAGPQQRPTSCQMRTIYGQLDEVDADALRKTLLEIIGTPGVERRSKQESKNVVWLTDTLNNMGLQISRTSVTRHIKGRCSCESI